MQVESKFSREHHDFNLGHGELEPYMQNVGKGVQVSWKYSIQSCQIACQIRDLLGQFEFEKKQRERYKTCSLVSIQ